MVGDIINIAFVILGFVALLGLIVVVARPDRQRHGEDQARAFFDEHGHWPDEAPPR
jgi:hypothetical protein